MRWKEPRAFAAADHASQRAHQRRGRRTIRRRVSGQCVEGRGAAGRLIPHARAIRALVIAMIEASFRAPPMALSGRPDRGPTRVGTADRGAIGMAPIARAQIAKRRLQRRQIFWRSGVSTASEQRRFAPTGRTVQTVAQQTRRPRRVGARGGHEGPEVQSGPSPSVSAAYAISRSQDQCRGRGRCRACGRTERAHKSLGKPHRTRFPTPPTAFLFLPWRRPTKDHRQERPGDHRPDLRGFR